MANRKNKMERRYTNIIPSGIGKEDAKMSMNKLKIHKNMVRRETSRNQIDPDEGCLFPAGVFLSADHSAFRALRHTGYRQSVSSVFF